MPRMREAMRSGWKASSPSIFSETPTNLIGWPVTCRTESAAPPRASPSSLVSTMPVSGSASLNARAASWPCIESTTKSVSFGFTAACNAFTSAIIASSMARRPAVSTISTSW